QARSHAAGGSRGQTEGVGGTLATSTGRAITTAEIETDSDSYSRSSGRTQTHARQRSRSNGRALQLGESEQVSDGTAHAVSHGETPSENESWSENRSVSTVPFYEIDQRLRVSSIEYVSREEQAIEHIQEMKYRRVAECMLSVPMNPNVAFFRFDWKQALWI